MQKSLDRKLAEIHADPCGSKAFILADAKDADMAFGIPAMGPIRQNSANPCSRTWKTLSDYQDQIRQIVDQGIVDIMLMSPSTLETLAMKEGLFKNSTITPAARANDTTDIWVARGGSYTSSPSRGFRTATIDHIQHGKLNPVRSEPVSGADLGLYSITFTNHIDEDHKTLENFRTFRLEAEEKQFRYFLEVFNPNIDIGMNPAETGSFLNDCIVRCLAGVTSIARPLFLKIPYNGPKALEELVYYDQDIIVGILGGSAGTTFDAFQLIYDAQKYGARVALFGRKINLSEHPLAFIELLRAIVADEIRPSEAVKAYHGRLQKEGIRSIRSLEDDLIRTSGVLNYD